MHQWREGHSLRWRERHNPDECEVCFDNSSEGMFVCDGMNLKRFRSNIDCRLIVHQRCLDAVTLPCLSPANFSADRIRAAFLRCFASLLYNYRKFLEPIPVGQRKPSDGRLFNFKLSAFVRSASRDIIPYLEMLAETQAFNEFIMERCLKPADDPEIALFDQIIMAKRNRGRYGLFGKQGTLSNPNTV
jgi:dDENN domain